MKRMLLLLSLSWATAQAQLPCQNGNAALLDLVNTGKLKTELLLPIEGGDPSQWSSSVLKAKGAMPIATPGQVGYEQKLQAQQEWACQFSINKLFDGNTSTFWAEGGNGLGYNEVLLLPQLDPRKPVKIWIGLGQSQQLYAAHPRPKTLHVFLIAYDLKTDQDKTIYTNFRIIDSELAELKDLNGFQTLAKPQCPAEGNYLLGMEILDIYPGNRYKDLCITELKNE
jgi:hypothetical protein